MSTPENPWRGAFLPIGIIISAFLATDSSRPFLKTKWRGYKLGFYPTLCDHYKLNYVNLKLLVAHHPKARSPSQCKIIKLACYPRKETFSEVLSRNYPEIVTRMSFSCGTPTISNWVAKFQRSQQPTLAGWMSPTDPELQFWWISPVCPLDRAVRRYVDGRAVSEGCWVMTRQRIEKPNSVWRVWNMGKLTLVV